MAFTLKGRTLSKIGVVGSGQIGPDIALFFSKVLAPHGVSIVVVDVSDDALAAGKKKTEKKISKGVESGAFKPELAEKMLSAITFTSDYDALSGSDLVVEAATEDKGIKHKIMMQLEGICAPDAILASNSSHMQPEAIFENVKNPGRCTVIHYFFPAERNVIVEIIPGEATDAGVSKWLLDFYEAIGKVPIEVKSRYGYAVDPVFEGLFQAAALCVESGMGDVKTVDAIARKALGLGIGPFTAMNLTGGNPITAVGLDRYQELHENKWFRTPRMLADAVESGEPWQVAGRGEKVEWDDETFKKVSDAMTGAYLGLVGQILDSGITNISDFEMALETSLVVRAPFAWMNKIGAQEALRLVEAYAADHPDFLVPECIKQQAEKGQPFEIPVVLREDVEGVAVLTIRRPQVLNALNEDVFSQLQAHIEAIGTDGNVKGAVITGFGKKAFVSGGDIGMLAKLTTPEAGIANTAASQGALNVIEDCPKPVVCAMNGLAFGGGNELAMACHARLATKGLRVLAGQPEVNLGIIPGAGGTQRLPRWIGFEKAAEMMRLGRPISSADAKEIGLISDEVEGDLVAAAVDLVKKAAAGEVTLNKCPSEPLSDVPESLPEIDLRHLSTRIDAILCRSILEGAKKPLREGLELESQLFGEVCATEDMKIGMENFMKNGPRAKAEFVNR